ncbi:MAG: M3 family oligoendopeptidase [Gemmatimonadota bacterium]|nr:M3 family oligoendopeptidase [Gemmatimonadota bacterium]
MSGGAGAAAPPREGERAHRWRLEEIFPDVEAWEEEMRRVRSLPARVAGFRGRLAEGPDTLTGCLATYFDALQALYRVSSWASMRHHEDTRVGSATEREQRTRVLGTELAEAASFLEPEILALGRETIADWQGRDAALAVYAHVLDDILRRAPHTLSPPEESIVAAAGLVTDAPHSIYATLANADLPWPVVRLEDGEEVRVDPPAFTRLRSSAARPDREVVFRAFFGVWKDYERTFGATLNAQVKRDVFQARVRRYPSALAAALDGDAIPEAVYRTLLAEAEAGLPTLHRYFRLRARLLGIERLRYHDLHPPLVERDARFPIEAGCELLLASARPLGEDCTTILADGLAGRWMDVYPRPGKRSGAYMNGHVYALHPYLLLNYNDDYDSVSTLAHEWGHALHSCLANRAQPFATARYSIFVAEVASTLQEALLQRHMLAVARPGRERLFFLGHALESLRGTFFRQAMFAAFELAIHETVEGGEALSGERLTAMYGALLRRYHGHDADVVRIDEEATVEWAWIPHFYYDFYVYQYATSLAASSLLAEEVAERDGRNRYLDMLRAGGSDYPYELLCRAGVDLATPEPYRALRRRMDSIMDEIEAILAEE